MNDLKLLLPRTLNLFLCFSISICLFSQSGDLATELDSLESILLTGPDDTIKLDAIQSLFNYYHQTDLDRSLELAHQQLQLAQKINEPKFQCWAYEHFGSIYFMKNADIDTVLSYFEKSLDCCESLNDIRSKCVVIQNMATIYHENGFYVDALIRYQEALDIAVSIKDTFLMIAPLGNIAGIYQKREENSKALDYYNQALHLSRLQNDYIYTSNIMSNIANVYCEMKAYDTALVLFQESLAIKKENGFELSMANTLASMGGVYVEMEDFAEAEPYLEEAYTISKSQNYPYGMALSLKYMGKKAFKQQQFQEAISHVQKGLELIGKRGGIKLASKLHHIISQSYEGLNQADSALVHYKISQQINDSLFNAAKEFQIQTLEITYDVKQKEIEFELLKNKLMLRNYLSIGLVIAFLLTLGLGIAIYRNSQVRKRMNAILESQVAERTRELQESNKQLEQANYELTTFNYIASHDLKAPLRNIGSYASIIYMMMEADKQDQLKQYFDIIQQSTAHLYRLLEDLASYSHLSKGESGKKSKVDLMEVVDNIEKDLQTFLEEKNGKIISQNLPHVITNNSLLFIGLKNLVENGIKFNHSPNPEVSIHYQSTESHHQILVIDNGIGIDSNYHEQVFKIFKRLHTIEEYEGSGIGLAIVKLVIEKLGGSVELVSKYGKGSTFIVSLPKQIT